jgi:hypothetical protein
MSTAPKRYTLPLSPSYVEHWDLWAAVREIVQNAFDAVEAPSRAQIQFTDGILRIVTPTGTLTPDTLVLGKSSKRGRSLRGSFGEGYKLSLLVLARLGHHIEIRTNQQLWTARIERDENFDADVLNVYVEDCPTAKEGVEFLIHGLSAEQFAAIQRNIRTEVTDTILTQPSEQGRIYVGGLYVATMKDFHCGYSFRPGAIKLNRDRDMVSGFDLAWLTSSLWTETPGARLVQLLEAEAPDVEYVESHAQASSPAMVYYSESFSARHGSAAIPVSNQEEIQNATAAGLKWVLVSEKAKSLLRLVRSWFIPTTASAVDQLKAFRKRHRYSMNIAMLRELDEIICGMEQNSAREEELT